MLPVVLVVLHVVHRPNHLVMKWTLIKHTHTHSSTAFTKLGIVFVDDSNRWIRERIYK